MTRMLSRLIAGLIVFVLGPALAAGTPSAQLDPDVRDRVVLAAVEIGIVVHVTENGESYEDVLPMGSGTIVSPHGLILTNWHVVDMAAHREQLDVWEVQASEDEVSLALDLDDSRLVILTTGESDEPERAYHAQVVAEHHALDLAVLQITSDADGLAVDPTTLDLPFVSPGDSSIVRQGDPIHIFGYPVMGGGTLQYTTGVVSGFSLEQGIDGRAWINTDATMAGGSSGGTAVDAGGRLIGVPTQGAALDCRPGDTNFDGTVDAQDVGCIPVGGSIGQLRPINLARAILTQAGFAPPSTGFPLPPEELEPPSAETPDAVREESDLTDDEAGAEDEPGASSCLTSPLYPVGTEIVLPRSAPLLTFTGGNIAAISDFADRSLFEPLHGIPSGTVVEITREFRETGTCDVWPIRYRFGGGAWIEGYIDERDLRPAE